MSKEHKAIIVHYEPGSDGAADELNALLSDDWSIVSTAAMGGAGNDALPGAHFAALVILEREEKKTVGGFGSA
ncbi:MAG: hypothetical protein IIB09_03750 [Bacteroidetes bacterium]|nr:hypothetical protein [Bacteroidota bacterium]